MLTRNEYIVVDPAHSPCARLSPAIVVDGPGRRGEVIQVCADPECDVHAELQKADGKLELSHVKLNGTNGKHYERRTARTIGACWIQLWSTFPKR